MPIYEYHCDKCEQTFEVTQRITEDSLTTHEGCGGPVRRLISRTAFTLKGSGWYSDGYGLKGNKKGDGGTGAPPSKDKSGSKADAGATSGAQGSDSPAPKAGSSAPSKDTSKGKTESGGGSSGSGSSGGGTASKKD